MSEPTAAEQVKRAWEAFDATLTPDMREEIELAWEEGGERMLDLLEGLAVPEDRREEGMLALRMMFAGTVIAKAAAYADGAIDAFGRCAAAAERYAEEKEEAGKAVSARAAVEIAAIFRATAERFGAENAKDVAAREWSRDWNRLKEAQG